MQYRASFCDPLQPDIVELGDIAQDQIIGKFESIRWSDYLQQMKDAKESDIHYSPSLEIEHKESKHGLSISAVGEPTHYEFYIFYKRPKIVKVFYGLKEKLDNDYTTDIQGQTRDNVLHCLNALIKNDTTLLADLIGE